MFLFRSMDEALSKKLRILADAAKYDASCASSGAPKRSAGKDGLGSTTGAGICHAYTPDGRCVSLLKILLTNFCIYDCAYCINRASSNVERARFSVDEVVERDHGAGPLAHPHRLAVADEVDHLADEDLDGVGIVTE